MKTFTKNLLIVVAMITAVVIIGCPQKSEPKAPARYTVTFDKNHPNAKGSMEQQTFEEGVEQKLTPNLFSLTHYEFKGWALSPYGDKKYIDQQSITVNANITLYAIWEIIKYTVTFNANGGTGSMEPQIFTDGKTKNLSPNAFSRDGYSFIGWATRADGTKEYENKASFTTTSSITLYAVWVETYMTFGEWPQTVLPNDSLVTIDESQSREIGMFTYYKGSDDAWYVKQPEKSRYLSVKYSDDSTIGRDGTTFRYFKVEPITWRVLDEKDGKKFLIAEKGLIGLVYYDFLYIRTIDDKTVYSNNYKHSKVRAWLNGYDYFAYDRYANPPEYTNRDYQNKGFLQTAFTNQEQAKIATTTVDNSVASTLFSENEYVCEDTQDKVFLLSAKEVTTESYGFNTTLKNYGTTLNAEDTNRFRCSTDFSLATGGPYNDWYLRSPLCHQDDCVYIVDYNGASQNIYRTDQVSGYGCIVVPALWVMD